MVTVSVAGVPEVTEPGLIEHCGARAGAGCTEQVNATESLNPPEGVTSRMEEDEPPGLTVLGVRADVCCPGKKV